MKKTIINLSGLTTKTITEPKIQETSTVQVLRCLKEKNMRMQNCNLTSDYQKDLRIWLIKKHLLKLQIYWV